jgi:hypothetical protein
VRGGLPEAEFESLKRQLYQLRETLEASVSTGPAS